MDGNRFDDLTRRLGTSTTRRAALRAAAGGFLGALGLRNAASAEVSQAYCGNVSCKTKPGKCKPGCLCCAYPNGTSRCGPPGNCGGSGVLICPAGQTYCPDLGRCAACCTNADCGGDLCTGGTCVDGVCDWQPLACGPDEVCDPEQGCVCSEIPCGNGSCCPGGTFCCSAGPDCIDGCCAGEVAPSGWCCLGEVTSEGVCCQGNIACGPWCCDAGTQECNEELEVCYTVRACPIGFEEVNGACFRIVPSLDYCRGRVEEVCGSACTNCIGSVDGSSNYLCARATDYVCPSGESEQCIPGFSACYNGSSPANCFEAC